jgi:hypothetical protein
VDCTPPPDDTGTLPVGPELTGFDVAPSADCPVGRLFAADGPLAFVPAFRESSEFSTFVGSRDPHAEPMKIEIKHNATSRARKLPLP